MMGSACQRCSGFRRDRQFGNATARITRRRSPEIYRKASNRSRIPASNRSIIRATIHRSAATREASPRRSLQIPEATIEMLDNLLPLRLLIEGEAAMLAANSVARSEVANTLSGINAEKPQMAERQDLKGYLNANQRSHVTL